MKLKELIANQEEGELIDISRKIFAEEVDFFIDLLPPSSSRLELIHILYHELDELPWVLLEKILHKREVVLKHELSNPTEKFDTTINNILRLTSKYKLDLPYNTVINAIENTKLSDNIRLKFAIYLSNKDNIEKNLFIKIVENNHFLLPALFNHFKYTFPFEALNYLDRYIAEANILIIRPMIRSLLINLLSVEFFNIDNYKEFIFFQDSCNPETQKVLMEILELTQLKSIRDKLGAFTNELINSEIGEIFSPQELLKAKNLVNTLASEKHSGNIDFLSYNINAVVFAIVDILGTKKLDRDKAVGKLFLEFNRVYKEKFHLYLYKYGASYNPIDHEAYLGDQFFPFTIEPKSFKETQEELFEAYKYNREEKIKELL